MIRVISVHINEPRFIYYQKKLLDKFIDEPFEFIVFDDSGNTINSISKQITNFDSNIKNNIEVVCNNLGVKK